MKDIIYIAIILIMLVLLIQKPDPVPNIEKDYDNKLDSIMNNIDKRKVIEQRITNNVNHIIQTNDEKKLFYNSNDSIQLIFIDSILRANGYR